MDCQVDLPCVSRGRVPAGGGLQRSPGAGHRPAVSRDELLPLSDDEKAEAVRRLLKGQVFSDKSLKATSHARRRRRLFDQ